MVETTSRFGVLKVVLQAPEKKKLKAFRGLYGVQDGLDSAMCCSLGWLNLQQNYRGKAESGFGGRLLACVKFRLGWQILGDVKNAGIHFTSSFQSFLFFCFGRFGVRQGGQKGHLFLPNPTSLPLLILLCLFYVGLYFVFPLVFPGVQVGNRVQLTHFRYKRDSICCRRTTLDISQALCFFSAVLGF